MLRCKVRGREGKTYVPSSGAKQIKSRKLVLRYESMETFSCESQERLIFGPFALIYLYCQVSISVVIVMTLMCVGSVIFASY